MPRAKKNQRVGPELRKEWLRRADEDGETVPSIANKEGYDTRTVRKAVNLARQEREMREARTLVFRKAVEEHYADLIRFAGGLDSELAKSSSLPLTAKSERMWGALRQHMPQSPMWRKLEKLRGTNLAISNVLGQLEALIEKEFTDSKVLLEFTLKWERIGRASFDKGLSGAIMHALQRSESSLWEYYEAVQITAGINQVRYGPFNCGTIPSDSVEEFKKLFARLVSKARKWQESEALLGALAERTTLVDAIREDLATIMLRRVVPGQCKYCPM